MTIPYLPPRATRAAGGLRSVCRFRMQARRGLDAITGQAATLVRAATGTCVDSAGVTVTVGHSMPRYESRAWGDEAAIGVRLAADDLTWPCDWLPETATLYVAFSEAGTRTTSGAGLVYVGNDGQTGARLILDASSNNYRATIHNGTTSQSVSASSVAPTTGQAVHALVWLEDDGSTQRVRLFLDVETTAGDEWTAWSSTVARAATWGSGARLRVNRVGSAGTQGSTWLRELAWAPGLLTLEQMRGRL